MTTTAPVPATAIISRDPYARSADLDHATADMLATRLETRGAHPQQSALRQAFLSRLPRRAGARVLEVGCGTGIVARDLAAIPGVASVVGVDPSRRFIERARSLSRDDPVLHFEVGDGTALPFGDHQFDMAVFATTLCHVIDPRAALGEAFRVLVPGGTLLVFDGDYATATVAQHRDDPLQACVTAAVTRLVHDPWLVRRLRTLVAAAGFVAIDIESHGYVESDTATYMSTIVDFGASALAEDATVSSQLADALKAEARNRIASGTFFGHIAYASVLATRSWPAPDQPNAGHGKAGH
jgi:ubiquinone/menaquinone biosynthesis C-methylase UbiE